MAACAVRGATPFLLRWVPKAAGRPGASQRPRPEVCDGSSSDLQDVYGTRIITKGSPTRHGIACPWECILRVRRTATRSGLGR